MGPLKLGKNLLPFRLVTFDVTDTLLKFSMPPAVQYAKTASNYGYSDVDQAKIESLFRTHFKRMLRDHPNFGRNTTGMNYTDWWRTLVVDIFQGSGANIPSNDLNKIANKLIEQYETPSCWRKFDGSDEILCKIKTENKVIGIISNFDSRLHKTVRCMNLPGIDFILTSYEKNVLKPDIKIFDEALKLSKIENIKPKEALHIGNTPVLDYIGARNAGWSSLLITNYTDEWRKHPEIEEKFTFNSLRCLINYLEKCDISW